VEQEIRPPGILEGLEYIEFNRNNSQIAVKSLAEYVEKKKKEKDRSDLLSYGFILGALYILFLIGKGK